LEKKRRKAETDCRNPDFATRMNERKTSTSQNFEQKNRKLLKQMSGQKPPLPRIEMPDGVEVHQYSCQKLNIWEFQKD
jgi:hypothetical protein